VDGLLAREKLKVWTEVWRGVSDKRRRWGMFLQGGEGSPPGRRWVPSFSLWGKVLRERGPKGGGKKNAQPGDKKRNEEKPRAVVKRETLP